MMCDFVCKYKVLLCYRKKSLWEAVPDVGIDENIFEELFSKKKIEHVKLKVKPSAKSEDSAFSAADTRTKEKVLYAYVILTMKRLLSSTERHDLY